MSWGVPLKTLLENQSQQPELLKQQDTTSSCRFFVMSFSGWQSFLKMQEMQSTPTAKILKLLLKIMLSQGDSAATPLHKRYLPCICSPLYAGGKESCSP